jgi:hypothetical protein
VTVRTKTPQRVRTVRALDRILIAYAAAVISGWDPPDYMVKAARYGMKVAADNMTRTKRRAK